MSDQESIDQSSPEAIKSGRRFSKEHAKEERSELASEISNERREYFRRKQDIQSRIRVIDDLLRERNLVAEEARESIRALEEDFSEKTDNLVSRIFNRSEIKRLQTELGQRTKDLASLEKEFIELQTLLGAMQEEAADRSAIGAIREKLHTFYAGKAKEWEEYEHERKVGAVENVSKQYDAFVVHAIHPTFVPGDNSMLRKGTDWKKKLDIFLTLTPAVSASTIRRGDGMSSMWARMGVILSRGHISDAARTDAASKARGLKRSRSSNFFGEKNDLEGKIKDAVTSPGLNEGYNELIVQEPTPAAFYYSIDENRNTSAYDRVPPRELKLVLDEIGLPLVVLHEGRAFEPVFEDERLILGKEISKEDLLAQTYRMDPIAHKKALEELFEDSPFRIYNQEVVNIDSRGEGRRLYMRLRLLKDGGALSGPPFEDARKDYMYRDGPLPELLGTVYRSDMRRDYLRGGDGKVWERTLWKNAERRETNYKPIQDSDLDRGTIDLGSALDSIETPIANPQVYLEGMRGRLQYVRSEIDKYAVERPDMVPFMQNWLENLGYHLYGFAEQASQMGDEESRHAAEALAEEVLPLSQYAEVVARRIDEQGRFKITIDDLKARNAS